MADLAGTQTGSRWHGLVLAWAMGLSGLGLPQAAAAFQVCVGDVAVPPFLSGDPQRPGISERLMMDTARQVGIDLILLRWPARRCYEQMRLGLVEAGVGAAIPINTQEFDFPGGAAGDPQMRIARAAIVLVRRDDAAIQWDGQALSGPPGRKLRIGARMGFRAAIEVVHRLGMELTPSANQSVQVLRMLQLGRLDLAILVREEANALLARHEFSHLTQMDPPLLVSDFYVMTIRQLPEARRRQVQRWWALMAQWRDLPAYQPASVSP